MGSKLLKTRDLTIFNKNRVKKAIIWKKLGIAYIEADSIVGLKNDLKMIHRG